MKLKELVPDGFDAQSAGWVLIYILAFSAPKLLREIFTGAAKLVKELCVGARKLAREVKELVQVYRQPRTLKVISNPTPPEKGRAKIRRSAQSNENFDRAA